MPNAERNYINLLKHRACEQWFSNQELFNTLRKLVKQVCMRRIYEQTLKLSISFCYLTRSCQGYRCQTKCDQLTVTEEHYCPEVEFPDCVQLSAKQST